MPSPRCVAGQPDRVHHGARLGLRLALLVAGVGVGDDPAAGLQVGRAVAHERRADVDAGVEVAGVGQVADRPAVGAALDRLELVDDLHRADLGRARERAGGQRRAHRVHRRDVLAHRPRHRRDDVDHVRVDLDGHQLVDLDAAVLADPAQVVAARGRRASRARRAPSRRRAARRSARLSEPVRGRVPAIGRSSTCRPVTLTSDSGEAPAISKSSKSRKYMYGLGLIARRPR